MTKRMQDSISGIFLFMLGAIVYLSSMGIKRKPGVSVIGSDVFPKVAAVLLVILGVSLAGKSLQAAFIEKKRKSEVEISMNPSSVNNEGYVPNWKAAVASIFALLGYLILLDILGFLIMTFLYLFIQILILTKKRKGQYLKFAVISIVADLCIYAIFIFGLSVFLPNGIF